MQKILLLLFAAAFLVACSEDTAINEALLDSTQAETDVDSFRMGNAEIRQDIINALLAEGIEHWQNEDGSIGFHRKDTERVDAIGFFAIGAYAARQ